MEAAVAPPRGEPVFRAVLTPNRSLSRLGFALVMGALCAVSFAAGIVFALHGAWPVFGFFGLDVLLLYGAFKLSYRSGRLSETLELTPERLVVRRIEPSGESREWQFQPYWLRVELDEAESGGAELALASHGRRLVIGSFLSAPECASLALALKKALLGMRATPGLKPPEAAQSLVQERPSTSCIE